MSLPPWWIRREGVLQEELDALAANGWSFTLDKAERDENARIVLRGFAPVSVEDSAPIAIVYPDTFPDTPPSVYRTDDARLPRHQNPVLGNYCLLGRVSRDWRPSLRAADLVLKIPRLTELVERGGQDLFDAEEPQGEPFSAFFPHAPSGAIVVPEAALGLPADAAGGSLQLRFADSAGWVTDLLFPGHGGSRAGGQALLARVDWDGGECVADTRLAAAFTGPVWTGRWVRIDDPPLTNHSADFRKKLDDSLPAPRRVHWEGHGPHRYQVVGVLFTEETGQGEEGPAWTFCISGALHKDVRAAVKRKEPVATRVGVVRGQRYSRHDLIQRVPELRSLGERTLCMIGLGGLGGPLARQIARGQPAELRVADRDVHDAAASVRGSVGLDGAGSPKTERLAFEMAKEHPYVSVVPYLVNIGGAPLELPPDHRRDADVIAEMLAGADVLVEASAEAHVRRAAAAIAHDLGIPQVVLWGVDGHGGVVARIRPGTSGCLHCLALSHDDGSIRRPEAALNPARVQPKSCADTTFAAADTELLPLVNQAARILFSTLTQDDEAGYPEIEGDVFTVQLRRPDGSALSAPVWTISELPIHPKCPVCNGAPQ